MARTLPPRVERGLGLANALAVTTYLWHIPCITIAGGLLFGLSRLAPGLTGAALSQAAVVLVTWLLIVALIPLIGRLEYALIPPLVRTPGREAVGAYLLLTAGTALVWLHGTVIHPSEPWSSAGLPGSTVATTTPFISPSRPSCLRASEESGASDTP